ncbi:hypothetical protein AYL99_08370 [Fonsecaea erecta]|uniref:Uncharacterized protein n=1 Tax=Fonsecaea erecta TaxID=1367422 RepID=A0A178ZD98_9EURO|nr:hypothetical protein AYL99_08370 [Fonsecaea erecta]OAP57632.1 hypothetical protein AYL99_08370 [Fonsecaea erecta]
MALRKSPTFGLGSATADNKLNHKMNIPALGLPLHPTAETIEVSFSMLEKLFWYWIASGSLSALGLRNIPAFGEAPGYTLDRRDHEDTKPKITFFAAPPRRPPGSRQQQQQQQHQAAVTGTGHSQQVWDDPCRPVQSNVLNTANDVVRAQDEAEPTSGKPDVIAATAPTSHEPQPTVSPPHSQDDAGDSQNQCDPSQGKTLEMAVGQQESTGVYCEYIGEEWDDSFMDEFVNWGPDIDI